MPTDQPFPVRRLVVVVLAVAMLGLLYFTARKAFDSQPLSGEEGKFAALVAYRPAKPVWNLYARINGEPLYGAFQHPAPMYELIRAGGWAASWVVELDGPNPLSTPRLRTLFSLYAFVIWAGLLGLLIWRFPTLGGAVAATLLVGLAVTPLAIVTSQNLQTDGSVGVLLTGLAALLLLRRAQVDATIPGLGAATPMQVEPLPDRRELAVAGLAGVIASLGKQEWSLALFAAVVVWLSMLTVLGALGARHRPPVAVADDNARPAGPNVATSPADPAHTRAWRRLGLALLAGAMLGNLMSLAYDPGEYLGGFAVMKRFSADNTVVTDSLDNWWRVNMSRGAMLAAPLALGAWLIVWGLGSMVSAASQRRLFAAPRVALVALFGLALLAGYLASSWNAQPRYFAPALVVLAAAVTVSVARQPRWPAMTASVVLILLSINLYIAHSSRSAPPEAHRKHLQEIERFAERLHEITPPDAVMILPTALAWNKPDLEFINESISPARAVELAASHGKRIQDLPQ